MAVNKEWCGCSPDLRRPVSGGRLCRECFEVLWVNCGAAGGRRGPRTGKKAEILGRDVVPAENAEDRRSRGWVADSYSRSGSRQPLRGAAPPKLSRFWQIGPMGKGDGCAGRGRARGLRAGAARCPAPPVLPLPPSCVLLLGGAGPALSPPSCPPPVAGRTCLPPPLGPRVIALREHGEFPREPGGALPAVFSAPRAVALRPASS